MDITRCLKAVWMGKSASLVINGASLHRNMEAVISSIDEDGYDMGISLGKVHLIDGEIAYNSATSSIGPIDVRGKSASFIMDGGSIHHNVAESIPSSSSSQPAERPRQMAGASTATTAKAPTSRATTAS